MKVLRIIGLAVAAALVGTGGWRLFSTAAFIPSAGASAAETREQIARDEIALVEEVVSARESYLRNIEKLVDFYTRTGNTLKLRMAQAERETLIRVKQHDYVIVAEALGPDLRPRKIIPEAEKLYEQARHHDNLQDPARKKENKGKALELYLQLVSRYHESIRIADAAYYAGDIYETVLEDYYSAMVYFERTYQWDPLTSHPARIRAARLAYYKLKDMKKAKGLYEEAQKSSPVESHRTEAGALVNLLKAWGY